MATSAHGLLPGSFSFEPSRAGIVASAEEVGWSTNEPKDKQQSIGWWYNLLPVPAMIDAWCPTVTGYPNREMGDTTAEIVTKEYG